MVSVANFAIPRSIFGSSSLKFGDDAHLLMNVVCELGFDLEFLENEGWKVFLFS